MAALSVPSSSAPAVREQVSCVAGAMTKYGFGDHTAPKYSVGEVHTLNEVSGYLFTSRNTSQKYRGQKLEHMLLVRGINLNQDVPFVALANNGTTKSYGVVKMNNIPFTVTTQEIIQFINKYSVSPMIEKHKQGCPVHIIMEKPTGKTMDCYVEFPTHQAALQCVQKFSSAVDGEDRTRIGDRNIGIDLSDQAELMEAIFPRARFVEFDPLHGKATELRHYPSSGWSTGFQGFVTLEEMFGVVRFAESPMRSPFVQKCRQRVYECMISTLYKFPWSSPRMFTVAARNALFETVYKQLSILLRKVDVQPRNGRINDYREVGLGHRLLLDLIFAAINVPAFSLLQRHALCQLVGSYGAGVKKGALWHMWPFQTLQPLPGTPDHIIKFWLEIFETGYEIMRNAQQTTSYEDYLMINRNPLGFTVAEWTSAGTSLNFHDAAQLEKAVMMIYMIAGRQAWANERHVATLPWSSQTLRELSAILQDEELDYRRGQGGENQDTDSDIEISPKSSRTWDLIDISSSPSDTIPVALSTATSTLQLVNVGRLNPATVRDFVPRRTSATTPQSASPMLKGGSMQSTTSFTDPFSTNARGKQPISRSSFSVAPHEIVPASTSSAQPMNARSSYTSTQRPPGADFSRNSTVTGRSARTPNASTKIELCTWTKIDLEPTCSSTRRRQNTASTFHSTFPDDDPFSGSPGRSRTLPNLGLNPAAQDFGPVGSIRRATIPPIGIDGYPDANHGDVRRYSVAPAVPESEMTFEKMRAKSIPSTHRAVHYKYGGYGGDGRNEGRGRLSGSELFEHVKKEQTRPKNEYYS